MLYNYRFILNLKTTKIIIFESNQQNNASSQITCRDEPIKEEMNIKFLGLEIDTHMNWKTHTEFNTYVTQIA
jgi:hypothetical protein